MRRDKKIFGVDDQKHPEMDIGGSVRMPLSGSSQYRHTTRPEL